MDDWADLTKKSFSQLNGEENEVKDPFEVFWLLGVGFQVWFVDQMWDSFYNCEYPGFKRLKEKKCCQDIELMIMEAPPEQLSWT